MSCGNTTEQLHDILNCLFVINENKAAFSTGAYPLRNSAILDSGATIHIFSERHRFTDFRPAVLGDGVYAGDGFLQIIGYGSVPVQPTLPPEAEPIILQDVALIRKMACNLVSLRQLRREGIYWDMKQQRRGTYLRDKYDEVICELEDKHGQFVIEDLPRGLHSAALTVHRHRIHSATSRSRSGGTANLWHLRLGHSGPEAVAHLTKHTEGVRIRGPTTVQCDACGIAKVKQRIRRAPREGTHNAAQRWAFDIVPFEGDSEGFRKMLLIVDQYSGLARGYFIKDAQTGTLKPLL